jgi:hypothetical protein
MTITNKSREIPKKARLDQRMVRPIRYSIADILIATTMVGVLFGAAAISLPLSIGLFGLAFVALLRTLLVQAIYGMQSGDRELTSFWLEFFASIAIIFWSGVLGGVIVIAGFALGFALARDGGPPIPDAAMWPIVLSLVIAAIIVSTILWSTRNVTRRSF